ncbi:acid-sensing ion channel 1A-like [Glandiceps talaboti]
MLEYCGCVDTFEMDSPRCRLLNKTEDMCKQLVYYLHREDLLPCNCPQPCTDTQYTERLSTALWPSDRYMTKLLRAIRAINPKTIDINDKVTISENLLSLEVFYEEINYGKIEEYPAYEILKLVSDIGGTLGLYVGLSMITICEGIEFLYQLAKAAFKK